MLLYFGLTLCAVTEHMTVTLYNFLLVHFSSTHCAGIEHKWD